MANFSKKIECNIIGLSQTQAVGENYIVVLEEEGGDRKLPVIVRDREAQFIALQLEKIETKKIFVWDIFESLSTNHNFTMDAVYLHSVFEGIFYTKVITNSQEGEIEINISVGDALCLATKLEIPIYVSSEVMDTFGLLPNGDDISDEPVPQKKPTQTKVTLENLQKMLDKALEEEDYEIASQIRDKIKAMKGELE